MKLFGDPGSGSSRRVPTFHCHIEVPAWKRTRDEAEARVAELMAAFGDRK